MANINLSTGEVREKVDLSVGQGGLVALIVVLVLILVLYGVEIVWGQQMTKDTEAIQTEFSTKYKNLSQGNPITVVDFQNRLTAAKKMASEGRDIRGSLLEIEKSIIPGVYLKGYEFDQKAGTIVLTCIGDNYNLAAKQILNFKKSTYFSDASGGETTFVAETGKVEFKVNLTLK
ncbi:MAG: hypothetical protein WCV59_05565 [Parcubacteria group bacterium]|jgi:hypothetical protein